MLKSQLARKMLNKAVMSQLNIKWEGWSEQSVAVHYESAMTRIALETSAKPAVLIGIDLAKGPDETVVIQSPTKPQ